MHFPNHVALIHHRNARVGSGYFFGTDTVMLRNFRPPV